MRKIFFLLCFVFLPGVLFVRPADANEAMFESFKTQIQILQNTVEGLQTAVGELNSTVRSQNEVIEKQIVRIEALEKAGTGFKTAPTQVEVPEGAPKLQGRQGFNPEIGVVGTVQAQLTESTQDADGRDTVALKELELNVSQYVDPYSRLDGVVSFNDNLEAQNVDIEEGYYTHWGLPFGFVGQIGKFRSKVGKQNLLHLDLLETADYPVVIRDFFGEEGLSSSGARLQNMIPNPWEIPIEVTGELLRGNNGNSFSGVSRRPIFNTHAKSFFELTEDATVELGWTTMFGDENIPIRDAFGNSVRDPKGQDRYGVHVYGGDATLIWNLPENRTLKIQNELYFQERSNLVLANEDPWGFYSLVDFRFSPRWSTGIRFDCLEPLAVEEGHERTTAISPYLTFWQSEFASFRLQYTHTDPADPAQKSDDAVLLQAHFVIGSHKHPVQ